ncbi:MAG: fatty acyl-AMP ligase [Xenococcaceae cyanobacterium]
MSGLKTSFKASTLVDLLRYRAKELPERVAYTFLVDGETDAISLTHQELDRQVRAIATQLQSLCSPGDRVLLLYQPSLDYIAAFFGCLYAGVVAVPAYPPRPNRSLSRLKSIINDASASIALTTSPILTSLERTIAQTPGLEKLKWLEGDRISLDIGDRWCQPDIDSDTLAFLQYTSGSTAEPKGVKISHNNLLDNLQLIHQCFQHDNHSQGVIWLPPYHDMGLIGGILQPLYGGFPVALMSPLMFLQNPMRWLQAISRYKATTSGAPNFAYDLCVRKVKPEHLTKLDLSSWEVAFNGAEPINYDTLVRFANTFAPCGFRPEAFYPCYGMAEATLIVSGGEKTALVVAKHLEGEALEKNRIVPARVGAENSRILVGCGKSLLDRQIAIVHPEHLTRCDRTEVGEIWVSGSSVAKGYWGKPEESKRTFEAYLADTKEGPFLRTGDLGFIEDGELFVTGRLKDVIIINGRNHYPQDIERTVEQSNSFIRPSCAAGFSVNINGEERLVVLAEIDRRYWDSSKVNNVKDANTKQDNPDAKELIRSIRQAVSQHHDLQVYETLLLKPGSIPKTSSGKIQRHICRTEFLAGTLQVW